MLEKIQLELKSGRTVWFTSDTHFCHNKDFIYKERGFDSIEEHDRVLIERWNDCVSEDDWIVHCGDFMCGSKQPLEDMLRIVNLLKGNILLLWGNHNSGSTDLYNHFRNCTHLETYPAVMKTAKGTISFVGETATVKVLRRNKKTYTFFCSHFAHRIWDRSYKNEIMNVCGHSHGRDPETHEDSTSMLSLDVGIDVFTKPINFDKIVGIVERKRKCLDQSNQTT